MADSTPPMVLAAGGVVTRPSGHGREVLVVHRPRYDDWALPKGKLDPGESWEDAAAREVIEETSVTPVLGEMLPPSAYLVKGRPKIVVWFAMTVADEVPFEPNDEVDEIRWLAIDDLDELLSYADEVELIRSLG